MVLKENSIVCARTENMAYQIREKCKQSGLNPKYINNVNDLFKYLITNRPNLIIVEKTLEFYKDIFIAYLDNFCKDCIVVFVGDRDEVVDKNNSNFYYSTYNNLEILLNFIIKNTASCRDFTSKIPEELVYKYTTEALLELKFSPSLQGYTYIKQCVIAGVGCESSKLNLNQNIYEQVAKLNNTTVANVEKSIRIAIKKTIQMYPDAFKIEYFKDKKVTNASVITYLIITIKIMFINNNYKN